MRVMLDTNCIDSLLADGEAFSALINRKDIRLLLTTIQFEELQAVPDAQRRQDLLDIANSLCSRLSTSNAEQKFPEDSGKHAHDKIILEASLGCDLFVSNDTDLLELAVTEGKRAVPWGVFVEKYIFSSKKNKMVINKQKR